MDLHGMYMTKQTIHGQFSTKVSHLLAQPLVEILSSRGEIRQSKGSTPETLPLEVLGMEIMSGEIGCILQGSPEDM